MYAGDKIVYKCRTPLWGLHGGGDVTLDVYGCTQEGTLDLPDPTKGEVWPKCHPQQDMIITAAEMMLDRFDRMISDRYKMIDYREEDNQKQVVGSGNYLLQVTLPVCLSEKQNSTINNAPDA